MGSKSQHYKIVIIGGGAAGISTAARLARSLDPSSIAIIEPSTKHYYQPLWTVVGAGLADAEETVREQSEVIPAGTIWIRDAVTRVEPEKNRIVLKGCVNGCERDLTYDYLVVASGLRLAWERIEGLEGNLGKNGLCSIYQFEDAKKTAEMLQGFTGGRAIFSMPPPPIKCAGAPQKIMYLADEIFRKNGVRDCCEISFATAGKAMFGIPVFSKVLDQVVERKGIKALFQHKLVAVKAAEKIAVFEVAQENGGVKREEISYDLLHLAPPMEAHAYVRESGLAFEDGDQKGWLKVDKQTLQHLQYQNIFGVGDVTGVPNSKTGAAVRKQVPVAVGNLLEVMKKGKHGSGRSLSHKYDGYSSCPLITGIGKVVLAEFGYDSQLMPTFPLNPAVERYSMWILKRHALPLLYWKGMLKGLA